MDDVVAYVTEPAAFRLEGSNVYVEVRSGGRTFCFEFAFSTFAASFANAGIVVHDWSGGKCEVVQLDAIRR